MPTPTPRPFEIAVPQAALDDLHARLALTRLPPRLPGDAGWALGTDPAILARLVDRWRDGHDWRAAERELNRHPHFTVALEGADVHYVRLPGAGPDPFPLVLTHGWPGSFIELLPLGERLAAAGYEVVIPSLPGYGFSAQRPEATDPSSTSRLWHRLMTEVLGHARYGAHGGDVGAGVTTRLGALFPEALAGIHLTAIGPPAELDEATLSDAERAHRDHLAAWASDGGAYHHQQRTRPMTLAYGLTDSPAGLLAWIVEKLRAWSDCGGDLATRFTDDEVLTWVSLYWLTDSIATSFRPYNDGYARPESTPQVSVPAALAVFPGDISQPPRAWAERSLLALARYTPMPRGGHFAGWEEPALLAADIAAFFDELR